MVSQGAGYDRAIQTELNAVLLPKDYELKRVEFFNPSDSFYIQWIYIAENGIFFMIFSVSIKFYWLNCSNCLQRTLQIIFTILKHYLL